MAKIHGSSIEDNERYEALRNEGMSKEKAARIANTPPDKMGPSGGSGASYEALDQGGVVPEGPGSRNRRAI
jgi:hypothetical protein